MNDWPIWIVFCVGLGAGIALGWVVGNAVGFYFGRILERKRIAGLMANQTVLEVVKEMIRTGKLTANYPKKAKPVTDIGSVRKPKGETTH